jgi:phage virion morphogenesis protein
MVKDTLTPALDGLVAALKPSEQKKLAEKIGQRLIKSNAARIKKNIAPDGTAFAPRLPQNQKNKIQKTRKKRQARLFQKMANSGRLQQKFQGGTLNLAFKHTKNNLEKVHHFGLSDKVNEAGSVTHQYAERPLLGINQADEMAITDSYIQHLTDHL